MHKRHILYTLLPIFPLAIEFIAMSGICQNIAINTLLLLLGLVFWVFLFQFCQPDFQLKKSTQSQQTISRILFVVLFIILGNWVLNNTFRYIAHNPTINQNSSDVVPFLQLMANRFLEHKDIYAIDQSIHGTPVHPVYFPAFWMPLTLPAVLHFDSRILTTLLLILALAIPYFFSIFLKKFNLLQKICVATVVSGFFKYHYEIVQFYTLHSFETLIMLYLVAFAFAIMYRKWYLAGVFLGLLLMSRYYILLFLPIWFIFLIVKKEIFILKKVSIATLLSLFAIILLSRTSGELLQMLQTPFLYNKMIQTTTNTMFIASHHSFSIYAIIGYQYQTKLALLCYILPAIAPLLFFGKNTTTFLLLGLKFGLLLFLLFLPTPFVYLFFPYFVLSPVLLFFYYTK